MNRAEVPAISRHSKHRIISAPLKSRVSARVKSQGKREIGE